MSSRNGLMRQEIIRAATDLFEKQSVSSVTLSAVAHEVGLTKAALYHYFDTKEHLLRSIFAGWATACREAIENIAASELPPEEKLRAMLRTHVEQITSEFGLFVLSVREESDLPEAVRVEFRHLKRDTDLLLRDVIARGQADGTFQPVDTRLAELACIGMFNWMWRWYRPGRDDPSEVAELFIRIFVEGIRTRTGSSVLDDRSGSVSTAEYHAAEIRHHTEMLRRLAEKSDAPANLAHVLAD